MSVYEIVTNRIIEILEEGVIPWRMPWVGGNDRPRNLISKLEYRGVNPLLLNFEAMRRGFGSNSWLTWNQVKKLGGNVMDGETKRSTIVVFFKILPLKESDSCENVDLKSGSGEKDPWKGCLKKGIPLLRYYRVYNLEQVEGLKVEDTEDDADKFSPIEVCQNIVGGWRDKPKIRHGIARAYYSPDDDLINMPKQKLFHSSEEYYSTLFHESVHATGHSSRLARKGIGGFHAFGDEVYSKEELIAECGAAFLCARAGIENQTLQNSAAYITSWLNALKNDKRLIVSAASSAQRAVEHVLGER